MACSKPTPLVSVDLGPTSGPTITEEVNEFFTNSSESFQSFLTEGVQSTQAAVAGFVMSDWFLVLLIIVAVFLVFRKKR